MPKVVGVRFRTSTRMYYFAPTEETEYKKGQKVVVETQRGVELATVVLPVTELEDDKIVAPLKPILRVADESDIAAEKADGDQKQSILATAKQKVSERGLEMKIVDCEFTVDHSKLVLYFTAEQRVDFRELVRDLASAFHMRIDLRQIGSRDECKLIGSLGACGMPCCCGRFESDAEHVSIKMAKTQNLALTPNKINGMCGRLMCCLSYENKTYEDVMRRCPKTGSAVFCPDGRRGVVVSVTPLTEKVRVRVGDDDNFEFCEYELSDISFERREQKQPPQDRVERDRSADGKPTQNGEHKDGNAPRGDGKNRGGSGKNFRFDKNKKQGNDCGDNANEVKKQDNGMRGDANGGGNNKNRKRRFNNKNGYKKPRADRPNSDNANNARGEK